MPGTKNPTAPQSTNTTPAMQAYPTMTIPAEIAHQFTCRRGSEGIVTVISRTLVELYGRRATGVRLAQFELWCRPEWSCRPRQGARHHDRGGDRRTDPASHRGLTQPQRRITPSYGVHSGARAVEHLRLSMAELKVANVRT